MVEPKKTSNICLPASRDKVLPLSSGWAKARLAHFSKMAAQNGAHRAAGKWHPFPLRHGQAQAQRRRAFYARKSQKLQKWGIWQPSNFPSYFWDSEYWQRGTTQTSRSSTSTFEEVESLNFSKSSSQDSFHAEQWRKEPLSQETTNRRNKLYLSRLSSYQHADRHRAFQPRDSSSSLGTVDSTFDDLDSFDHGPQKNDILPSLGTVLGWSKKYGPGNYRNVKRNSGSSQSSILTDTSGSCHSESQVDQYFTSKPSRGKDLIVEDEDASYYPVLNNSLGNYNNGIVTSNVSPSDKTFSRKIPKGPFEHFFGYKTNSGHGNRKSDSSSVSVSSFQTSQDSLSSFSLDQPGRLPYESDYEYHVRMRRNCTKKKSLGRVQRSPSMESNSSSMTSSSSFGDHQSFGYHISDNGSRNGQHFKAVSTAEQVLLNLGFCGSDSFLPERFARDWYNKISTNQANIVQQMQTAELSDMWDSVDSAQSSGMSTPWRRGTIDMATLGNRGRRKMVRSNTIGTYHDSSALGAEQSPRAERNEESLQYVSKQDSIDQLREILEKHASILQSGTETMREKRRRQFASSRQISLPLHLETLSEEEEGKSPKPQVKKNTKSFMRSFFEEEQQLSFATQSSSETSGDESKPTVPSALVPFSKVKNVEKLKSGQTENPESEEKPLVKVPSIIITEKPDLTVQSSESLEVMEINHLTNSADSLDVDDPQTQRASRRLSLQLEPALVTTVLSDCRRDSGNLLTLPKQWSSGELNEDRLAPPSPCSSSSLSPIPQSPVTVIEANLDNQNDSLDTEDGRKDSQDITDDCIPNIEKRKSPVPYFPLQKHIFGRSKKLLGPPSSNSGVEADDGRLSPLVMFGKSVEGQNDVSTDFPTATADAEVQADDGQLSPLLKTGEVDRMWSLLTEMDIVYEIQDEAVQCNMNSAINSHANPDTKEKKKTELSISLTVPNYCVSDDSSILNTVTTISEKSSQTVSVRTTNASCQTGPAEPQIHIPVTGQCMYSLARDNLHTIPLTENETVGTSTGTHFSPRCCSYCLTSGACHCAFKQNRQNNYFYSSQCRRNPLRVERAHSVPELPENYSDGSTSGSQQSVCPPVLDHLGASSNEDIFQQACPFHNRCHACSPCAACSSSQPIPCALCHPHPSSTGAGSSCTDPVLTIHCSQVNIINQNNSTPFSLPVNSHPNMAANIVVADSPGNIHISGSGQNPLRPRPLSTDGNSQGLPPPSPSPASQHTDQSSHHIHQSTVGQSQTAVRRAQNVIVLPSDLTASSNLSDMAHNRGFYTIMNSLNQDSSPDVGNLSDDSVSHEILSANRSRHVSTSTFASVDRTSSASSASFL